jgi:hypothetical protein
MPYSTFPVITAALALRRTYRNEVPAHMTPAAWVEFHFRS